ncbi:UDP-N-acetylmuramoyl-L-alanine--D-glutamate ligase [Candidatus Cardinium hertigii]|uniref:UDP-N-acetylmuramoylalanine--D-glutamate ligase n=1 Tax=Candidatus Cardinium hertigii TaxID=247481 RepID=A0A3N2QD82_9BACT|nr:UDP-N-acetylmuramoyl-L-alanine--D-glutamate ligase [Candidatus Cardinium hertigii]ROT47747.1 UDP-N-acetylmuramoyl-L-alanine--D-glutamate ligase [Candidatus Cardinium hertigii]
MQLAILGGGESGTGAALLAKQQGYDVFVSDSSRIATAYKQLLIAHGIPYEENGHTLAKIIEADEIVKSPGIPNKAAIIQQLQPYTLPILDEIEFAARYAKGSIIAVTGSNGKSTTTQLIHHFFTKAGCRAALVGNIGHSFAKCLTEASYDYYVLELSSFQLENIQYFKPAIACVLNITADHLDRYDYAMAAYAKAKLNILRNMTATDHFIYPKEDPSIQAYLTTRTILPQCYPIASIPCPPLSNSPDVWHFNIQNQVVSIKRNLLSLLGPHNQYNATIAITAALLAGIRPETIIKALPTFHGLPHRLEWCGAPQGIDCYNDSKSTNVASTAAALRSFKRPIIWIAGGKDKGNDYTALLPLVQEKVKAIICLGKDNRSLIETFGCLALPIRETTQIIEALRFALGLALPGEAVLLSPACASFDLFKNFEDRGNQFKTSVNIIEALNLNR